MQRCDELLGKGLSKRLSARSGRLLRAALLTSEILLLPSVGQGVGGWWLHDFDGRGKEHDKRRQVTLSEATYLLNELE